MAKIIPWFLILINQQVRAGYGSKYQEYQEKECAFACIALESASQSQNVGCLP